MFSTAAEETFFSQGDIDNSEEVTLSLRNATVTVDTSETNPNLLQNRTIGDSDSASTSFTTASTEETEYRDPLAQINLESDDFYLITKKIVEIANLHSKGSIISFLEGGYDLIALSESIKLHLKALCE